MSERYARSPSHHPDLHLFLRHIPARQRARTWGPVPRQGLAGAAPHQGHRAAHLMHLESGRFALYRETTAFLAGEDPAPMEDG